MARMNPVLFANTVIKQYPDKTGWHINRNSTYYKSLLETMLKLKPVNLLHPDSLCYRSALCHALTIGNEGTVTHDRTAMIAVSNNTSVESVVIMEIKQQ